MHFTMINVHAQKKINKAICNLSIYSIRPIKIVTLIVSTDFKKYKEKLIEKVGGV